MEFSFTRLISVNEIMFYVTVFDKNLKSCLFTMKQIKGEWKIIDAPKVPQWIHDVEKELENAIKENLLL